MKRFMVAFAVVLLLGLLSESGRRIVFAEPPEVKAEWEVLTPASNTIGSSILAVLRVTVPKGVLLRLDRLPEPGKQYFGFTQISGVKETYFLEIRDKSIRRFSQGNFETTEITYTFQYLSPIDFESPSTKVTVRGLGILYVYLTQGETSLEWKEGWTESGGFEFYLLRRVDANSLPEGLLPPYPQPINLGFLLKVIGGVIVALTILGATLGWVKGNRRKHRLQEAALPSVIDLPAEIRNCYARWKNTGDFAFLLEGVLLYRVWVIERRGLWGERSNPSLWRETTELVYGGLVLKEREIEETFTLILKEVGDGNV